MSFQVTRSDIFDFAQAIGAITRERGSELVFRYCPYCHGGDRRDEWTFSINLDTGLFCCQRAGCGKSGGFGKLCKDFGYRSRDNPKPQEQHDRNEADYTYRDLSGQPVLRKRKWRRPDGSKYFRWQHMEEGCWKSGANKIKLLYGLPSLRSRPPVVYLAEGEKDADTVTRDLGFPCLSLPDGAREKTLIWSESFNEVFSGKTVYVLQDHDDAGHRYGQLEAAKIASLADTEVYLLDLAKIWPEIPKKGDISDMVAAMGAEEAKHRLADLISNTEPWTASTEETTADQSVTEDHFRPGDFSDAGNAELFAAHVKDRLLWCDALGWLCWDGRRWDPDEHAATALAIDFAQQMLTEALAEYKTGLRIDADSGKAIVPDTAKNYLQHAQRSRNANRIQNMLMLAKARLHIKAERLDADWQLLNTATGLVDLRTGEISRHDPLKLCTKIAPFTPSAEGEQLWRDFLGLLTDGDQEYQDYLQLKIGSFAFGRIHQEGVDFWVGGGRNGKSTLANTITRVLGDYAGGIDSTVLTTDRQNRGAALATLRGKRFVTCGELEEGQRLSVQTLKRIASTDMLTIEEKYRQPETVIPSHHIVLFSNFLPRVGSTDQGTWRRISVMPFCATMPSGDADIPNYAEELVEKAGGAVLAWIIQGAVRFSQAGFHYRVPQLVKSATEDYKQGENWLENFISERCLITDTNSRVRASELYAEYKSFAASTGDFCRRGVDFSKAMESAGFRHVMIRGKPYYYGIRVDDARIYGDPPPVREYY